MYTPIVFETAVLTEKLYVYRELKYFYDVVKPYTQLDCQNVLFNYIKALLSINI